MSINFNNNNSNFNAQTSESWKRISSEFKNLSDLTSKRFKKRWNNLSNLQRIVIVIILIGLPSIFLLRFLYNLVFKKKHLNPDLSDLDLSKHKNIPLISSIDFGDINFVKEVYEKYYNKKRYLHKKINNGLLDFKLQLTKDKVNNKFTYSFWIYIVNDNENCLNTYLKDKLNGEKSNFKNNWFNYKYKDYKLILHRGSPMKEDMSAMDLFQYPGFWLDPKMTNLSVIFAKDSKNESFILENLEMNKWINITCSIDGYGVFIYKNGKLQLTGTLKNIEPSITKTNIYYFGSEINNYGLMKQIGFPGYLAFFNYYNRVLSVNEVDSLYKENKEYIDKWEKDIFTNCQKRIEIPDLIPAEINCIKR